MDDLSAEQKAWWNSIMDTGGARPMSIEEWNRMQDEAYGPDENERGHDEQEAGIHGRDARADELEEGIPG